MNEKLPKKKKKKKQEKKQPKLMFDYKYNIQNKNRNILRKPSMVTGQTSIFLRWHIKFVFLRDDFLEISWKWFFCLVIVEQQMLSPPEIKERIYHEKTTS